MRSFEKRVPKGVWGLIWPLGYESVPEENKRAWLEDRFFLPGGWPECADVARVESLTRMRRFCWNALVDVVVLDVASKGRGRPRTRTKKQQTLYYVLHRQEKIQPEWQWPLIRLAIDPSSLSAAERLWLAGRSGVLPPVFARLFCIELAVHCAERTKLHRGLIDEACGLIRDAHNAGSISSTSVRKQLRRKLPNHPATLVFLEVMAGSASKSVRKTLGEAARLLKSIGDTNRRRDFAAMLGQVIVERSL